MSQLLLELAAPPAPTFDNFVVGANAAVLAALRAFGNGIEDRCLYLWGVPGSGRSHLLRAWLHAHDAVADCAQDDVESLENAAQIALFNRINQARDGRGHVLVTGNAPPAQLPIRADLRSRLAWGLAFEIVPLSDEDKRAALLRHAQGRAMALGEDVLAYLMKHVRRDMPTLAGIVDALDRLSLETKRPVTLPLVRELLAQNRTLDL